MSKRKDRNRIVVPPVLPWEMPWVIDHQTHRRWTAFAWVLAGLLIAVAVAAQL